MLMHFATSNRFFFRFSSIKSVRFLHQAAETRKLFLTNKFFINHRSKVLWYKRKMIVKGRYLYPIWRFHIQEKSLSFEIALLGCIVAVIAFNIFYNGPFMLQLMEYAVQPTIEYLNDFHFYISQKRMEMVHAKLKEENRRRKVYSPRSESDVPCPQHSYRSRIIHRKPLIIYIENFITKNEINHILELTYENAP